jgi:hypothetical protein
MSMRLRRTRMHEPGKGYRRSAIFTPRGASGALNHPPI